MNMLRPLLLVLVIASTSAAFAGTALSGEEGIQPFTVLQPYGERIVPTGQSDDDAMLTTHDSAIPLVTTTAPSPFQYVEPAKPAAAPPAPPLKIPFGRAERSGQTIPGAPHITQAVPVLGVDAVESSDAAPPTPIAPEIDPAQEDPAEPTDLTSPIFEPETGVFMPRRIVMRALNKVTAQSELISLKPNDIVKFGQLEITAVTCRTSSPTSQTDYAALLVINEKLPENDSVKPLFSGWMYASSPSITALEHPIYDVTMVECRMTMPAAAPPGSRKPADKSEKPRSKSRR